MRKHISSKPEPVAWVGGKRRREPALFRSPGAAVARFIFGVMRYAAIAIATPSRKVRFAALPVDASGCT
jgi:hypothetical protein